MSDTYIVSVLDGPTVPAIEVANSAQTPFQVYPSKCLIWNGVGSGAVLRVRSVEINAVEGRQANTLTKVQLARVTAMVGGTSLPIRKMDSSAADLPAQITAVLQPASYTLVGAVRSAVSIPRLDPTAALRGFTQLPGPAWPIALGKGLIYTSGFSETQSLTIQENQGFVLQHSQQLTPSRFQLTAWIRVAGASYVVSTVVNTNGTDLFGVGNATGSGVVVYLDRLELVEIGDASLPMYTVERVDSMAHWNIDAGSPVTPIKMDTASSSLPAQVKILTGAPTIQRREPKQDVLFAVDTTPVLRRHVFPTFGVGPALASGILRLYDRRNPVVGGINSDVEHVIREGEGLAIFQRATNSAYGQVEFVICVSATVTPPASGGESSFTWVS